MSSVSPLNGWAECDHPGSGHACSQCSLPPQGGSSIPGLKLSSWLVPEAPDESLGIVVMDQGDIGVIEPWPCCESRGGRNVWAFGEAEGRQEGQGKEERGGWREEGQRGASCPEAGRPGQLRGPGSG